MNRQRGDEERGIDLPDLGREDLRPLCKNQETLLHIIYYGEIGTRAIKFDLLLPFVLWLEERLLVRSPLWGRGSKASIPFFAQVVNYFSESMSSPSTGGEPEIQEFLAARGDQIARILEKTDNDSPRPYLSHQNQVLATVRCIALWAMSESMIKEFENEPTLDLYCKKHGGSVEDLKMGRFHITKFVALANLVPAVESWVDKIDPKEEIPTKKVNARLLRRIADMEIEWTQDVGKHLEVRNGRTLSVFCIPCRLQQAQGEAENSPQRALANMGFFPEYSSEVIHSYELLFGPDCRRILDDHVNKNTFPMPLDPQLKALCNGVSRNSVGWQKEKFERLWPRITYLEKHLDRIQPDSFWKIIYFWKIIHRDRRDSLAWYTFCFAVGVLVLTFLSTAASVIQAAKAFYPSNVPGTVPQASLNPTPTSLITVTMIRTESATMSAVRSDLVAGSVAQGFSRDRQPVNSTASELNQTLFGSTIPETGNGVPCQTQFVQEPTQRGAFDIIWSCTVTLFLCAYTSIHLNVPSHRERFWRVCLRVFLWTLATITAPELVLLFATGQKLEARRSMETWRSDGFTDWTIRHGFFVNMGGLEVKPQGSPAFPINSRQLHYMVAKGHIRYPLLEIKEMIDRSNSDYFQIMLTSFQLMWFVVHLFGRLAERLPVTTMEFLTLLSSLCTGLICYQWSRKPQNVRIPIVLEMQASIMAVRAQEWSNSGENEFCRQTPLDFVNDLSPPWLINIQTHLGHRKSPSKMILPRFTTQLLTPILTSKYELAFSIIYNGLFLLGGYAIFPTQIEHDLWQFSSFVMIFTMIIYWMFETYRWSSGFRQGTLYSGLTEQREKEAEAFSFWEAAVLTPLVVLYVSARTYILAEVFLGLRSLPTEAFRSISWANYIPHVF